MSKILQHGTNVMNYACFVGLVSIVALGSKEQLVVLGWCDLTKVEDNTLKSGISLRVVDCCERGFILI